MSAKTRRIISSLLLFIPCLVLIAGGIMKLSGAEPQSVVKFLTERGFGSWLTLLGLTELVIAGLILYPVTNRIGFLLACSYFGGAFCLELSGGQPPASAMFLALLWIAMFLKNRDMFFSTALRRKPSK